MTDSQCGWCGQDLPATPPSKCSNCGAMCGKCEDSHGQDCTAELRRLLAAERAQPRTGCLGCPMVDEKCPHCGNELMP